MKNDPQSPTRSELELSHDAASTDTNLPLPMPELFNAPPEWPQEIIVEPPRLASGVWGEHEGDISAAYCADTFPKIKAFVHEGQLYTNCGGTNDSMTCYPLIPTEHYNGRKKQPHSREGETVNYKHESFTLGPKIKFTSRPRTFDEETSLLRRMYAYGGQFAANKSYRAMLLEFLDRYGGRQGEKTAIETELARENLPNTQAEMLVQIGGHARKSESDDEQDISQPTLPGF
jgi:hypothetical protein